MPLIWGRRQVEFWKPETARDGESRSYLKYFGKSDFGVAIPRLGLGGIVASAEHKIDPAETAAESSTPQAGRGRYVPPRYNPPLHGARRLP
jgi:hypothetical protein